MSDQDAERMAELEMLQDPAGPDDLEEPEPTIGSQRWWAREAERLDQRHQARENREIHARRAKAQFRRGRR